MPQANSLIQIGGSAGAGVFNSLNLRDSIVKKEKQVTERLQEQSRKRSNMRDLLVQNFMKKYTHKLDMHATTTS